MPRFVGRVCRGLGLTCGVLLSVHCPGSAAMAEYGGWVQFCWTLGRFDDAVYYAEAENREDRKEHFSELLKISGIEYGAVSCFVEGIASQNPVRKKLLKAWEAAELELVDTTFLSDMDY